MNDSSVVCRPDSDPTCTVDGLTFTDIREAQQHMVDEHGWDRAEWEEINAVLRITDRAFGTHEAWPPE